MTSRGGGPGFRGPRWLPLKTEKSSDLTNYFFKKGPVLQKDKNIFENNIFEPQAGPHAINLGIKYLMTTDAIQKTGKKSWTSVKRAHFRPPGIDIYAIRGEGPPPFLRVWTRRTSLAMLKCIANGVGIHYTSRCITDVLHRKSELRTLLLLRARNIRKVRISHLMPRP